MFKTLSSIPVIGWTIIFGMFFLRLAGSMSMPFLAIYLTEVKGVSPGVTGAIIGTSALVGVFSSFIGGYLSDKYGRNQIMILGIAISAIVYYGFATLDTIFAFFILNALVGIGRSFYDPASRAILSEITEPENRLLIYNLRYASINAGVAIGPLVGIYLGSGESVQVFFITAVVNTIFGVVLYIQLRNHKEEIVKQNRVSMKEVFNILLVDRVFLIAIVGFIFSSIGFSQLSTTFPQYFANSSKFEDGVHLFSYMLTLNAVTVLVLQYPLTRIGKNYSPLISIMLGGLTVSMGVFGIGLANSVWMIIASVIVYTMGEVLMFSMTDVFIDELAPDNLKATYFGAMGFNRIGASIGPWIGGSLLSYFGYERELIVFGILACITLCSLPAFVLVNKMRQTQQIRQMEGIK